MRTAVFVLFILALPTPAVADQKARLSVGAGLGRDDAPLQRAYVEHYAIGARVTNRDWITASFARLFRDEIADLDAIDARLWEVSVTASRMTCSRSTWWLCAAYGVGVGYQSAGKRVVGDAFPPFFPEDVAYDLDNLFVEARVAGRLSFNYAWLDLWVALRIHAQLDRSSPGDNIDSGPAVGAMLSLTP